MRADAARQHRELERRHKDTVKRQALAAAADEVELHEAYLAAITSVHRDCGPAWDWAALRVAPPPARPHPSAARETAAAGRLAGYVPGFFDRVFGREPAKRAALAAAVAAARQADAAANDATLTQYDAEYQAWAEQRELAGRVLAGEHQAYRDVIEELSPFAELQEFGSVVQITFPPGAVIAANVHVDGDAVIPAEAKSLLQSGKLSVKKMPVAQFHALYQDYVCGAVLRVARELFALLPVDAALVTAVGRVLDTSTGHLAEQPLVSVAVPRRTLAGLDVDALDPSDALRHFVHRMDFQKTKGLRPVPRLTAADVALDRTP